MDDYRKGFRGPGKLDGSLVTWVNGALLRAVGRAGRLRRALRAVPVPARHQDHDLCTRRTDETPMDTTMSLPILPTSVIGSYSMPEWLERAKNDYLSRRLSRRDLDEMHDTVRKAAIKDQEVAGVDIVSDGEAQRDNMIDYFTERCPACRSTSGRSASTTTSTKAWCESKLAAGSHRPVGRGAVPHEVHRTRTGKISVSGPHTLVKRIQNKHYPSEEAFALDLGRVLNFELKETGARRHHRAADRRALLLRLSRRPAVGGQGHQRDGGRREGQHHAAHLLREPLRQAGVRGQLPVSVPGSPRGARAGRLLGVRPPRRRGPAALQGIQRAVQAGPRRHRREDAGRGAARRWWPTASAARWTWCRRSS